MGQRSLSLLTILPFLLYFLFSSFHENTLFATAQYIPRFTPQSTSGSISAFIDGKVMYVHGGYIDANRTTAQSFALDLSTSWDVATPAYKQLPNGVNSAFNPGTLLNDSATLFIMNDTNFYYYNVKNGQLTSYPTNYSFPMLGSTRQAVLNPQTGRVYIPGGYYGSDNLFALLRFDPDTKKFDNIPMPAALQNYEYPVAWVQHLGAMLLFGGIDINTKQVLNSLFRYHYADSSWNLLPTSGDGPSPRSGACMTPVANGRKIVVFGGDTYDNVTLHDIYVLDVETRKWTRGADAPLADARGIPSCAVSNDMFVAFGGYVRDPSYHNNQRLLAVFSLKTNAWVDRFNYTPLPTGGGSGSGGSGSGGSGSGGSGGSGNSGGSGGGSGSNLGGIIGGIAAGCVVMCGIFYSIYRSRKAKNATPGHDDQQDGSFTNDPKPPPPQTTTTIVTDSAQHQPSHAHTHAQPASSMPAVFTPQPPPLLPRPPIATPLPSIPASNYYQQQTQQAPYQIPVVSVQAAAYPQQQLQYQQQIPYEQTQQHVQQEQERQQELEQQRIKQAQLEEELVLRQQIEKQMARLQTLKDQRQASEVGSPVPTERSSREPQISVSYPVPPLSLQYENESYIPPPSTAMATPGKARSLQIVQPRMNPQYTQPVEGDEYVDGHTGSRNPQLR